MRITTLIQAVFVVKLELRRPCRAHGTRSFNANNKAYNMVEANGQWVWKANENNNKSALKMKDIQNINDEDTSMRGENSCPGVWVHWGISGNIKWIFRRMQDAQGHQQTQYVYTNTEIIKPSESHIYTNNSRHMKRKRGLQQGQCNGEGDGAWRWRSLVLLCKRWIKQWAKGKQILMTISSANGITRDWRSQALKHWTFADEKTTESPTYQTNAAPT